MHPCKKAIASFCALALLAACAEKPAKSEKLASQNHHSSPPRIAPPRLPPGSFDQARATALRESARAARAAGDKDQARQALQDAIAFWPVDPAAWTELESLCQAVKDRQCQDYAAFFSSKLDFLKDQSPRSAALGFQNIAEEEPGAMAGNYRLDQATLEMGLRLWAFYGQSDPLAV
ncbi:MAG TPA: hypothetical protein HPP80_11175, partial [Rhodospirillaceae bacterium]|nr:hypothetical protein [Rhodospirillaceae bacterium]